MKTKKIILTILISAFAFALISLIASGTESTLQNLKYFLIYSIGFALFNNLYFMSIGKLLNWSKNPRITLITSILGSIPVNAGIYFLINYIISVWVFHKPFSHFMQHQSVLGYIVVVMFAMIVSLFIIIGYFFKEIEDKKLQAEQLKTQNERMRFEHLKTQFDPHFLFNNLNVLTSLIGEDVPKAEDFSIKLADIYRYVLDQKAQKLVPLKQELIFAKKYLELLKTRYEDDLIFSIEENLSKDFKIAPLSLQILLENAIKHNAISAVQKLHIDIKIYQDYLRVSNNKNKKNNNFGYGIGLESLKKRYQLLSDKQVVIIDNQDRFEIQLPLFK